MRVRWRSIALFVLALVLLSDLAARLYLGTIPSRMYIALDGISSEALSEQAVLQGVWDERGFWFVERETLPHVQAAHTLYMVGSSITQGQFVRNSETIASYLQQRLKSYRVVNLGAPAQTSASMLRQIRNLPLRPHDVVVMEGVSNDAGLVFFNQEAQALKCAPFAIVRFLCLPRPDDLRNQGTALDLQRLVLLGREGVEGRGATFLYVIVPYFYSVEPVAQRERTIKAQYAPVFESVYRSAWQQLYAAVVSERNVLDLSRTLDERRAAGQAFFRDIGHFDAAGNALVARAIYAALFSL